VALLGLWEARYVIGSKVAENVCAQEELQDINFHHNYHCSACNHNRNNTLTSVSTSIIELNSKISELLKQISKFRKMDNHEFWENLG
jgi:hypothetical protein